jgi:hypothetical protein
MSREQGPRFAWMRPAAKTQFRRKLTCQGKLSHVMAAEANTGSDRHDSRGITRKLKEGAV